MVQICKHQAHTVSRKKSVHERSYLPAITGVTVDIEWCEQCHHLFLIAAASSLQQFVFLVLP